MQKLICGFLCAFFALAVPSLKAKEVDLSKLPYPYNETNLRSYDPSGWYQNSNAMIHMISTYHVKTVIEVGSWKGASTLHIASLIPKTGKVYAVDHWEGSPSHKTNNKDELPYLYDQFLSNVIHDNLVHKIIPIRMDSLKAAKELKKQGIRPDLVYIDGDHHYEAVLADLNAWFPFVKGHGILCGDDMASREYDVGKAVVEFAKENNLSIICNGWFWYLLENE